MSSLSVTFYKRIRSVCCGKRLLTMLSGAKRVFDIIILGQQFPYLCNFTHPSLCYYASYDMIHNPNFHTTNRYATVFDILYRCAVITTGRFVAVRSGPAWASPTSNHSRAADDPSRPPSPASPSTPSAGRSTSKSAPSTYLQMTDGVRRLIKLCSLSCI